MPAARAILDGLAADTTATTSDDGWLSLPISPDRAAEINRALATAEIYASGLETGSDLESLFLSLTASAPGATSHEGTFFGAAGAPVAPVPPGWGQQGGPGGGDDR